MINLNKILLDKEQCLRHTWLTPEMFGYLLSSFEIEYRLYAEKLYKEKHWKNRERKWWAGRSWKLDTMEKKLFFGLYYLKTYQTYETLWWAFDMKRSRAYEQIENILAPLLEALKKTVWFLQPQKKNWIKSCQNIQKSSKFILIELKDQHKEVQIMKIRKKTIQEKRKDIHKKIW